LAGAIGSAEKFGIVDIAGVVAGKVLDCDEARGTKWLGMIGINGGEKLTDQRQRSKFAAMDLGAASGIASYQQASATFSKIAGIFSFFRDLPQSGQAYAI
jgi:hypothetical protein